MDGGIEIDDICIVAICDKHRSTPPLQKDVNLHECTECLSTEDNPYSTSLCKSHQIELLMSLMENRENAQSEQLDTTIPCPHGKGHCQCDNPRCYNYCD
jgi:hypothetical protein